MTDRIVYTARKQSVRPSTPAWSDLPLEGRLRIGYAQARRVGRSLYIAARRHTFHAGSRLLVYSLPRSPGIGSLRLAYRKKYTFLPLYGHYIFHADLQVGRH